MTLSPRRRSHFYVDKNNADSIGDADTSAYSLEADGVHVVWGEQGGAGVYDLGTKTTSQLAPAELAGQGTVALSPAPDALYLASEEVTTETTATRLRKLGYGGGSPETLYEETHPSSFDGYPLGLRAVLADSTYVYCLERKSFESLTETASSRLLAVPKTGGDPIELADDLGDAIKLGADDTSLFILERARLSRLAKPIAP